MRNVARQILLYFTFNWFFLNSVYPSNADFHFVVDSIHPIHPALQFPEYIFIYYVVGSIHPIHPALLFPEYIFIYYVVGSIHPIHPVLQFPEYIFIYYEVGRVHPIHPALQFPEYIFIIHIFEFCKRGPIGSAVITFIGYKQTDRHPDEQSI